MPSNASLRALEYAQDGRVDELASLLESEESELELEFVDANGLTPLMYAAKEDHAEAVEVLVNNGKNQADINFQSPLDGSTALIHAAAAGSLDAIDVLVRAGADVNIANAAGYTALTVPPNEESTVDARDVRRAIESAISAVENPFIPEPSPSSPQLRGTQADENAIAAAQSGNNSNEEGELDSPGGPSRNPEAERALIKAARAGDLAGVQAALDGDADPDATDEQGLTALMHAAKGGHLDVVKFLIDEASCDRDAQHSKSEKNTALMFAVRHGQVDCVSWMMRHGGCMVFGVANSRGETADTMVPLEKVTQAQMEQVIAEAIGAAEKDAAAAEAAEAEEAEQVAHEAEELADELNDTAGAEERDAQDTANEVPVPLTVVEKRGSHSSERDNARARTEEEAYEDSVPSQHAQPPLSGSRSFDPADARAFLDLPFPAALQLLIKRYTEICSDFNQKPVPYIISALTHVQYAGHALLLHGSTAMDPSLPPPARAAATQLNDQTLYPLLEVLSYNFANCPLQVINLSHNHLGRSSAAGLAVFLNHTHTLQSLDLGANEIDGAGCDALIEVLLHNPPPSLTRLHLYSNPLGGAALAKIASMLSNNRTLTDVHLGNTDMDQLSLMKIATALTSNSTLKRLNLDTPLLTSLQEETTIYLSRCLAQNHGLVSLSLKGHKLTDSGAEWLSQFLSSNRTIQELNLARNSLTTTAVAGFVRAIAWRPVECLIQLEGTLLTGQDFDEVHDAIAAVKEEGARNTIVFNSRFEKHSLRAKAPL